MGLPAIAVAIATAGGEVVSRNDMFFYTYVLKSRKDGKLYIGWTNNLRRRFQDHTKGKIDATRHRRSLELVYYEACKSKESAIAREKVLKSGFGRLYLKKRLHSV